MGIFMTDTTTVIATQHPDTSALHSAELNRIRALMASPLWDELSTAQQRGWLRQFNLTARQLAGR